jgi:hypothetical protein
MTNRVLHQDKSSNKLTKFSLPVANRTEHIDDDDCARHSIALRALDQYRSVTLPALTLAVNSATLRERINTSRDDLTFLQRLMHDRSITCKPADKNLGLALVDTEWYDCELKRMLADTITYKRIIFTKTNGRSQLTSTLPQLTTRLMSELKKLVARHISTLTEWYPSHADQMIKFLARRVTTTTMQLPEIYLLIKVHKPKGLCGRPIVPSMNWITTPASILVDHLLQEILRSHPIPWLVKDTKSLINDLESTDELPRDGMFITADVMSLYTNIDTEMGLMLINKFLTDRLIQHDRITLIMDLLRFVMSNSYLSFKNNAYLQIDGTAMGTSCAPVYANIVVAMLEQKILTDLTDDIYLYRRFLDDVLAYVTVDVADRFQVRLNSLHHKIIFDFVSHPTQAEFLDLFIYKGEQFDREGRFDLRVHQKKMNLYLYLPYHSYHTDAAKRSFIQTELMRYIRNSTHRADYIDLKHIFYQRLRDRGYPHSFLLPVFESIYYCDRKLFLIPSKELLSSHSILLTHQPRSACLIKRIARARQIIHSDGASSIVSAPLMQQSAPLVFIVPFTPLSRIISTRRLLTRQWYLAQQGLPLPAPIIAYQSYPSIMAKLVFSKARLNRLVSIFDQPKEKANSSIQSILPFKPIAPTTDATMTSSIAVNNSSINHAR